SALEQQGDAAKRDEAGAEERRPVQVAPQDEDREREEDAARVPPAIRCQQPEERDEEREDEALDTQVPRAPGDDEKRREVDPREPDHVDREPAHEEGLSL